MNCRLFNFAISGQIRGKKVEAHAHSSKRKMDRIRIKHWPMLTNIKTQRNSLNRGTIRFFLVGHYCNKLGENGGSITRAIDWNFAQSFTLPGFDTFGTRSREILHRHLKTKSYPIFG